MLARSRALLLLVSHCFCSLRVLTVYSNPIATLPEALTMHAAKAGFSLCGLHDAFRRLTRSLGLAIHLSPPN